MKKRLIITLISILLFSSVYAQNIISNGDMESPTGWTIYQLVTDTVFYQFNYITDGPTGGTDGCLKISKTSVSDVKKNIIFWQYVNLIAGKSYYIDANIKIGTVTSFWCEFYLSTIVPSPGVDYTPNGNADRVIGYSTWDGCGPNSDGLMSEKACIDKLPFTVPGTKGSTVPMVFGFKTGSNTKNLDIMFDNIILGLVENWSLISTKEGILDEGNKVITGVSPFISIADFVNGLEYSETATLFVIGENSGDTIDSGSTANMSDTLIIRVEGNQTTDYNIELRPVGTGNDIISLLNGTINNADTTITNLPNDAKVFQLISSVEVSQYATFTVSTKSGLPLVEDALISDDLQVIVTAENGDVKTYSIATGSEGLTAMDIVDSTGIMYQLDDYRYNLLGKINWRLTAKENPFKGSILNFKSDDVWLYFDNIRPSVFYSNYLKYILVDGAAAVNNVNIRVVQYVEGTVVISHSSGYKPMEIFSGINLTGNSMELGLKTYYRSAELGEMNNTVKSFRLKKGYMAALAKDDNGTGYSRVYIADTGDIVVNSLPAGLFDKVSFVRVFPWRWVSKKAWRGGTNIGDIVGATSRYDYNTDGASTLDIEYIPMWHHTEWNGPGSLPDNGEYTHYLGFNEPDRPDQADMTVEEMVDLWPQMMAKGLRLGSPAPSDGGLNLLYSFIDACDARNYRVDFVAMHFYRAGQTPQSYWDVLNSIHQRTGRPIWITEWNNGCNWTYSPSTSTPVPTEAENAIKIAQFTHMLDTASFVERYFVWDGCNESLQMTYPGTTNLRPAGVAYKDQISTMAFNHDNDFFKDYIPYPEKAYNPVPASDSTNVPLVIQLSWTPGELATSHKVYFGTSSTSLSYESTITDTVFDPGELLPYKRYYWRIDEVYNGHTTTGDLWTFRTGEKVDNVNPIKVLDKINIYPQPANNVLYIDGLDKSEVDIKISNLVGNVIYQGKNNSGEINIDNLQKGIYILQINGTKTFKFIKN